MKKLFRKKHHNTDHIDLKTALYIVRCVKYNN